jgi:chaperonin GroEL
MSAEQLLFHNEAHAKILAGMGLLANAVRVTLGPKARTVVLERSSARSLKSLLHEERA